jgi:bacterioferritin
MDKQTLIEDLNGDLAGALGAIIQHLTYAAKTKGRRRPRLTQFFLTRIPDEQAHAQFLAKTIVALGGEPTTVPRAVPQANTNREMVEAVLAYQQQAIQDYADRAQGARELSDEILAGDLEEIVRQKSRHSRKTERILRDWRL